MIVDITILETPCHRYYVLQGEQTFVFECYGVSTQQDV